jgi:hypothetical protein
MAEYTYQNLEEAIIPLICLCLPGIYLTIIGLRTIRTRRILSIGLSRFRWEKPNVLKGKFAIRTGIVAFGFGIILFTIGILAIIGILS